jgi:phosphotransferase system enzyme I (PtsP)
MTWMIYPIDCCAFDRTGSRNRRGNAGRSHFDCAQYWPGGAVGLRSIAKGIVLEEGSVGSHATIVARALAIPLIIHARNITTEALNGDPILVDAEQGLVHLRPEDLVAKSFQDKIAMQAQAQEKYSAIRDLPAVTADGKKITMYMNAGLMADLPSLSSSGAEGVGIIPDRIAIFDTLKNAQTVRTVCVYTRVLDAAQGKRVVFRTLDIGSDKVLPYMSHVDEPNPALGWRAIRVGLDKPGVLRMQLQAILRAANGRPVSIMFPFIAQSSEFFQARAEMDKVLEREKKLGHTLPQDLEIGAMLETPSLAYAPRDFFEAVDFISIGGNDLKQFFFAADRENELVRKRYDTQAPVTTSDEAPQVDEKQQADTQEDFFGFSLDALEQDPVLNRQVNVFRKVYFRSERIADKTSMEYVHAKQLSALLAK